MSEDPPSGLNPEFKLSKRIAELAPIGNRFENESVAAARRVHNQIIEAQRASSELDDKTGLLKQSVFEQRMKEQLAHQRRQVDQSNHGVFVLGDLDKFKEINDALGLLNNDARCLIPTATIISQSLRQGDFASRFGGEEFAIFVPGIDIDAGMTIATRIRDAVNEIKFGELETGQPISINGRDFLGISMGVVEVEPDATYEEVFNHAELLLKVAKDAGRNLVVDEEVLEKLTAA